MFTHQILNVMYCCPQFVPLYLTKPTEQQQNHEMDKAGTMTHGWRSGRGHQVLHQHLVVSKWELVVAPLEKHSLLQKLLVVGEGDASPPSAGDVVWTAKG